MRLYFALFGVTTLASDSRGGSLMLDSMSADVRRRTSGTLSDIEKSIASRDKEYLRSLSVTPVSGAADSDGSFDSDESIESPPQTFPDLEDQRGETIPSDVSENITEGYYELKSLVSHDEAHVLEPVDQSKKLIFKYQLNCFAKLWNGMCVKTPMNPKCSHTERDPDALMREYAFTKIVYDQTKLAPQPYVLSPPILLTSEKYSASGKTRFELLADDDDDGKQLKQCVDIKSTVRLLVEERVGQTVVDIFENNIKKKNSLDIDQIQMAAKIFHKSLIMLEKIHFIGIVHGDFHFGNLAFRHEIDFRVRKEDDLDLVFIDFGNALYYPSEPPFNPSDVSQNRYYFLNPVLISPFQLEGYRVSRRDDIYRAFESFIDILVYGGLTELFELAKSFDDSFREAESPLTFPRLLALKKSMDFCTHFPSENSRENLEKLGLEIDIIDAIGRYRGIASLAVHVDEDHLKRIQTLLREIQSLVRQDPSLVPSYRDLITKAEEIIALLYL